MNRLKKEVVKAKDFVNGYVDSWYEFPHNHDSIRQIIADAKEIEDFTGIAPAFVAAVISAGEFFPTKEGFYMPKTSKVVKELPRAIGAYHNSVISTRIMRGDTKHYSEDNCKYEFISL